MSGEGGVGHGVAMSADSGVVANAARRFQDLDLDEQAGPDYSFFEEEDDGQWQEMEDLNPETFRTFVAGACAAMDQADRRALALPDGSDEESATKEVLTHSCRLDYNVYVGQVARVVVVAKPPFNIVRISPALTALLGFTEHDTATRSLRLFQGPLTNVQLLQQSVASAAEGKRCAAVLMLYNKDGEDRLVTAEFQREPHSHERAGAEGAAGAAHPRGEGEATAPCHCYIALDHADWVPKKIAVAEDARAKAVLGAAKPNSVMFASDALAELYKMDAAAVVGRTLRVLCGPKTDLPALSLALAAALEGRTQNLELWTCRPGDAADVFVHLTVFPVAEMGAITHFMVVFREDLQAGREEPQAMPKSVAALRQASFNARSGSGSLTPRSIASSVGVASDLQGAKSSPRTLVETQPDEAEA